MANRAQPPFDEDPAPGEYGAMTVLPLAEPNELSPEELGWRVVAPRPSGRSTFLDGPPDRGNATAEELTWRVVSVGGVVAPPRRAASPVEADLHRVERELSELLTRLPPSDRELALDRLGQLLLAHRAA